MCRAVTCKTCGKTTWAGCGQHVDQVKATVSAGNWCNGHQGGNSDQGGANRAGARKSGGFFSSMFGR